MAVKCKINGTAKRKPSDKGECPECLTPDVPVTQKGFVGAHNVKINLGDGPTIPVTDTGSHVGDPRDAAVRREIEGIKIKTGARPADKDSVADPVFTTGHGRAPVLVRGRDMPPVQPQKGFAAAAGTMHGPIGRERSEPEQMVGGHFGYLPKSEYNKLSRTQQRKYWAKISKSRKFTADRRRSAAAQVDPVQAELKRLREIGA